MERAFCLRDKYGNEFGRFDTVEWVWEEAKAADNLYYSCAPHTVIELVPVPRPVPPRPTADIGGYEGCYFRHHSLYDKHGQTPSFGWSANVTAAADLWQRHQQWLADGGQDDA